MPITVINIENLFWRNGSYKFPNKLPKFKESKLIDRRPEIYNVHGGRVHLNGNWNYALFEGKYYFLIKEGTISVENEHHWYVMVRDWWTNIITNNIVTVNGNINLTNRDKWLEERLNWTTPIIANPLNITRTNFINISHEWRDTLTIRKCERIFSRNVISRESYEWFKDRHNCYIAKNIKKMQEMTIFDKTNQEVYVLGYIRPTQTSRLDWRNKLKEKLNRFLEEIKTNHEIIISKVKAPNLSPLSGLYSLTWKTEGIGSGEDNVEIEEIDLSRVTDIKPISTLDLREPEPNKNVEDCIYDLDEHFERTLHLPRDFLLKIHRKAYVTLTTDPKKVGIAFKNPPGGGDFDESKFTWRTQPPQKLELYDNPSEKKVLFLTWIDKLNFVLNWNISEYRRQRGIKAIFPSGISGFIWNKESLKWGEYYKQSKFITKIRPMYPGVSTEPKSDVNRLLLWDDPGREESIFWEHKLVAHSLGMLIFQNLKDPDRWERYEYLGESKLDSLSIISGINSHFINHKDDKNDTELKKTILYLAEKCGIGEISKKNDVQGYLNRLPKRFAKFSLWYSLKDKEQEEKWTSIQNLLLASTTYNGDLLLTPNTKGYPYHWRNKLEGDSTSENYSIDYIEKNNTNIYAPFNFSPFSKATKDGFIKNYQKLKWKIIKALSIIKRISLEIPIETGDYLLSELEYFLGEYNSLDFPLDSNSRTHPLIGINYEDAPDPDPNLLNKKRKKRFVPLLDQTEEMRKNLNNKANTDTWKTPLGLWWQVRKDIKLYDFGVKKEKQVHSPHLTNHVALIINKDGRLEYRNIIRSKEINLRLDENYTYERYTENLKKVEQELEEEKKTESYLKSTDKVGYLKSRKEELENKYELDNIDLEQIQAVKSVNGKKDINTTYLIMKKHKNSEEFIISAETAENNQKREQALKNAIREFYKLNGYHVTKEGLEPKILTFSEKDFEESNSEHLLFELVGTDWYCHIKRGKISLISKNPKNFKPMRKKIHKIELNEDLRGLSLVQKVNQKNYLNIYTYKRPINTKFLFNDKEEFNVLIESIEPTNKLTYLNTYFLRGHNKFDVIEQEMIQIPKNPTELGVSIADQVAIDSLKIELSRAEENRRLSIEGKIRIEKERLEESYTRKKWDLGMEKFWGRWNAATSILTAGMSSGNRLYDVGHDVSTLSAIYPETQIEDAKTAETKTTGGGFKLRGAARSTLKRALVGRVGLAIGAAGDVATSIANIAVNESWTWPERSRRIEKDRELSFQEIALKEYRTDLEFARREQDLIRKINRLSHEYTRGEINELTIVEDYNRAHHLDNLNLSVYYPNEEQTELLETYKEEYGIECLVPNTSIEIREGMAEEVIRFEIIEDEGLIGLTDINERDFLKGILERGLKIVDVEKEVAKEPFHVEELNKQINEMEKEIQELKKKEKELEDTKKDLRKIQEEKENLQKSLTQSQNRAETLSKEYKRLEARAQEQGQLAKLYLNQKRSLEAQLKKLKEGGN